MTWFEIYAAFGAPASLFAICAALVAFERNRRAHSSAEQVISVPLVNPLTTELTAGPDAQPRLARLVLKADANLARQAEIAAALHAELVRRRSDPQFGFMTRDR